MILTFARIFTYLLEYHFMRLFGKLMGWPVAPLPKFTKEQNSTLLAAFKSLLGRWKLVIKRFPKSNEISSPVTHFKRYMLVLKDLEVFLKRKDRKESHDLKTIEFEKDCPDYFKRNYHYQTEGYFSFESAYRYDHQIEILFLGAGHIMRKVAYSQLAHVLKGNESILEFGAGSGASGHQFKLLFPDARLDLLEPGRAYLDYAQTTYPHSFNELIPEFFERFKSTKKYDCIFSCFVMHEIPVEFWDGIVQSIKGSLKDDGHLLIIDSQQDCDKPEHQFALDQFAEDFYEPYYPEFRAKSLEDYFQQHGFKLIKKEEVLFSKSLLFTLK